jgi:hypothetical protein
MERKAGNMATLERPKQEASPVIKGKTKKKVKTRGGIEMLNGTVTWAYMVNEHGLTGDQLVQLLQAIIPAEIRGKPGTLVRVFAPTSCEARGVTVHDFNSLNEHPDLILYEGYYYGRGGPGEIVIEKRTGTDLSLLDRELRDGGITDVAMKEESSAAMKWRGRFGKFLVHGGIFLIILLITGIVVAVSVLTK